MAKKISHRQVEIFRALMLAGSVTKAAELLFTSQPTVSRELSRMENEFGFILFERTNARLRPTQSALLLFEEIKRTYIGLERVSYLIENLREQDFNQITVVTQPAFAHSILPGASKHMLSKLPTTTIVIESQESPFLEEWLSSQRCDLGLTEDDVPPAGTTLSTLMEVEEVCVIPPNHPLLCKDVIELTDFSGQNFISLGPNDPYRTLLDKDLQSIGVKQNTVIETPNAVSVCSLVRKGLGLAIVNPLTALDFLNHGLHIRPLAVSYPFKVCIIQPEHRPYNPITNVFISALKKEADELKKQLKAVIEGNSRFVARAKE